MWVILYIVSPGEGSQLELHLYDIVRGTNNRLLLEDYIWGFAWHPDSQRLAVSMRGPERCGLYLVDLNGRIRPLVSVPESTRVLQGSWSPCGRQYIYTAQSGGAHDLWVLTLDNEPSSRMFIDIAATEFSPAFSPNGQWLAYTSDKSGRKEVYTQRYPSGEGVPVSVKGGGGPLWHPDGQTLFFFGLHEDVHHLTSVSVPESEEGLNLGTPISVLPMRVASPTGIIESYSTGGNMGVEYDIFPDGKHFLMVRGPDIKSAREIVVVQNWFTEFNEIYPPVETP
jgi:hypothetical protein